MTRFAFQGADRAMPAPDYGTLAPIATAAGVIFAAWTTLRGSWDRALLKAFTGEMNRLQQRVADLETDVKLLRKELDDTQSELERTRQKLTLAEAARDQHAGLSAERARVILQYEAKIARLELRCETLENALIAHGAEVPPIPTVPTHDFENGDL